ncbi:MAG: hypothetical protein IJQ23_00950, partial [Clostridia bacterium]|nr:hypothetical protein [Clostridia bacterium]
MNLHEKPLYALRALATRLGVASPTSHNKDELISLIENRKAEIENNENIPSKSNLGRPRLTHCYIAIKTDDCGKLEFYDAEEPQVIIQKRPAAVKDEPTRKALMQVKDLVQSLYV